MKMPDDRMVVQLFAPNGVVVAEVLVPNNPPPIVVDWLGTEYVLTNGTYMQARPFSASVQVMER
jgi:hypothetical protein